MAGVANFLLPRKTMLSMVFFVWQMLEDHAPGWGETLARRKKKKDHAHHGRNFFLPRKTMLTMDEIPLFRQEDHATGWWWPSHVGLMPASG